MPWYHHTSTMGVLVPSEQEHLIFLTMKTIAPFVVLASCLLSSLGHAFAPCQVLRPATIFVKASLMDYGEDDNDLFEQDNDFDDDDDNLLLTDDIDAEWKQVRQQARQQARQQQQQRGASLQVVVEEQQHDDSSSSLSSSSSSSSFNKDAVTAGALLSLAAACLVAVYYSGEAPHILVA